MNKSLLCLVTCLLVLVSAGISNATIIDFENPKTDREFLIPKGYEYGGFNWSNTTAGGIINGTHGYFSHSGYNYGTHSGTQVGWIDDSVELTRSDGTSFDFIGAWFASAWFEISTITVTGYKNSVIVKTSQLEVTNTTSQWMNANLTDIDMLIIGSNTQDIVMDDFTFNASPVPEPSTVILLGLGLVGFAGVSRKRLKK